MLKLINVCKYVLLNNDSYKVLTLITGMNIRYYRSAIYLRFNSVVLSRKQHSFRDIFSPSYLKISK